MKKKQSSLAVDVPPMPYEDRCEYIRSDRRWTLFPSTSGDYDLLQWKTVAKTDDSVLITGETGTGKEDLARLIHENSNRSDKPFLAINLRAIPETLIDSELFGYSKGAFTGANKDYAGKLAGLDGGTVFLDELGAATEATQIRLLRFLQSKEIQTVGSKKPKSIDIRVLAATNAELKQDVLFRFPHIFNIPPLRERPDDIVFLLSRFLWPYGIFTGITPLALLYLLAYRWPGNARELFNFCKRLQSLRYDAYAQEAVPSYLLSSRVVLLANVAEGTTSLTKSGAIHRSLRETYLGLNLAVEAFCYLNILHPPRNRDTATRSDNTIRLVHQIRNESDVSHPNFSFSSLAQHWNTPDLYEFPRFPSGQENVISPQSLRNIMYVLMMEAGTANTETDVTSSNPGSLRGILTPDENEQVNRLSAEKLEKARLPKSNGKVLWKTFGKVEPPTEERRLYAQRHNDLTDEERELIRLRTLGLSVRDIEEKWYSTRGGQHQTVYEKIVALRAKCKGMDLQWAQRVLK